MNHWVELMTVYEEMRKMKEENPNIKQKVVVGNATLYTLGANNSTIRIDIKGE